MQPLSYLLCSSVSNQNYTFHRLEFYHFHSRTIHTWFGKLLCSFRILMLHTITLSDFGLAISYSRTEVVKVVIWIAIATCLCGLQDPYWFHHICHTSFQGAQILKLHNFNLCCFDVANSFIYCPHFSRVLFVFSLYQPWILVRWIWYQESQAISIFRDIQCFLASTHKISETLDHS